MLLEDSTLCLNWLDSPVYSAGSVATTNSTTSAGAMGGLGGMQNNMPNVGAIAPAINSNGMGNGQANIDATLSQAYTGIQQYAGLSGLVNQGKFHLNSLYFSLRCCCWVVHVVAIAFGATPCRAVPPCVTLWCRRVVPQPLCDVTWCFPHCSLYQLLVALFSARTLLHQQWCTLDCTWYQLNRSFQIKNH